MPPLRDRKEDIPLLAQHFLEIFTAKNKKSIKGFTPQSLEKITQYKWPGNVRELMNAVERAVVLSRSEYIDADELIPLMTDGSTAGSERSDSPNNMSLDEVEKRSILETINACGGNKSEAARRLGITRKTLRKKLDKYEKLDNLKQNFMYIHT